MKTPMKFRHPVAAIAAAGLINIGLSLGQFAEAQAPDAPPPPPPPGRQEVPPPAPPPPPAPDGGPQRGPIGEPGPCGQRPPARPEDEQPPVPPVDPQAAATAVKTAADATTGFAPGQVWTRLAPRGEPQLQATVLYQNKEVARLDFDPATGALLMRGQRPPEPPLEPQDRVRGPGAGPVPPQAATVAPPPPVQLTDNADGGPSVPVPSTSAPLAPAPGAPAESNLVKTKLPEIIKALQVGQGAEILDREGFWKVPLIYENRVVGELHLSADGTKLIEDFAAARDAAIFAR